MADLPIRKRTLAERLAALSERMRDMDGALSLVGSLCDEVYELGLEAADLADAERWKHHAALWREQAEHANELVMQWALAFEPPRPGRWHFNNGRVPHQVTACTDTECWSPIPMPAGRTGMLRLGWDVDLAMVSPRLVVRFDPEPGATQPGQDGG